MRLTDFLRSAVLVCGGAATALAVVAIFGARSRDDAVLLYVALGWWAAAGVLGLYLGRSSAASRAVSRMLATARSTSALPELDPARVIVSRLWIVGVFSVVCGALAFLVPQVPAIGCGYALVAALAWRRQESAVKAIEDRDGVRFYVERSSPLRALRVVRTPGLRKIEPLEGVVRQRHAAG